MIVENKKVVSVNYHLTVKENDQEVLVEKTEAERPFVFLFGTGGLLEDFEKNLAGKIVGDSFDFEIIAERGYGLADPNNVVEIPVSAFQGPDGTIDEEMVKVGNTLPMTDSDGNRLQGLVDEVTDEFVRMDFNHPLAGQDLHFKGSILEIREASEEEIAHGHVHGPDGHHH